jgi:VWFA-related protein
MITVRLCFLAAALIAAASLSVASAADPVRVEVLSVQEHAGRISATVVVYGSDGLPVSNLPSGSVRATLNGANVPVSSVQSVSLTRQPLGVLLVVDVSGSMAGDYITQARRALTDFVTGLEIGDQVAIMSFDSSVRTVQEFTASKQTATQAISRLQPAGDTALYDAVIEATAKLAQTPTERKLVVLLSDGVSTINLDKRNPSLQAAGDLGVSFFVIGLGGQLDRPYLSELASVTGGRFVEAPTAATLRQVYSNLAAVIRTQYTVNINVPEDIDRTVPGTLALRITLGQESGTVERLIPPLAGAKPPAFALQVNGVEAGAKITEPISIEAVVPEGVGAVSLEVFVDDQKIYEANQPPFVYSVDPATFLHGHHLLRVVATDARGGRGEKQVPFEVAAAPSPRSLPVVPLVAFVVVLGVAGLGYVVIKRHKPASDSYAMRVKPWRGRLPDVTSPLDKPPGEWLPRERPAAAPALNRPLGRVIVMDEAAVKAGHLDSIREFPIGSSPLTLGNTASCDIFIDDPDGYIAGEEARLWVQRGRLVYHKLTTLSAMATEGVTSGWQFLESGEDIRVGPCRLTFQLDVREATPEPAAPTPRLHELWPSRHDEAEPLGASSD